jgi:prevent-host-death family protein
MKQVSATEFKAHFGEFVDLVRQEPIEVLRGAKPVGVFLSHDEYEHLRQLDDAYWAAQASAAIDRGEFLSPEESMRWVNERLTSGQ